jgi:hypothetical protein
MKRLSIRELIDAADALANDLVTYASENGVTVRDLLMVAALSERLLQESLCAEDPQAALSAVLEADATYKAVSRELEAN